MGFAPDLLTKAVGSTVGAGVSVATGIMNSRAQRQAAKDLQAVSAYNQKLIDQKANILKEEAVENDRRMRKDANRKMGAARADAGASSLATEGSVALREIDMATRLETEIRDYFRQGLQQVNDLKREGVASQLNDQMKISAYKTGAKTSLLAGFGQGLAYAGQAVGGWHNYGEASRLNKKAKEEEQKRMKTQTQLL